MTNLPLCIGVSNQFEKAMIHTHIMV